jgi:hypothetical protein
MDAHAVAQMNRTAESFQRLAALRGVACTVAADKGG